MKTIYTDACVFTGTGEIAEAFMVEAGRFIAVGSNADLLAQANADDRIVSLAGRFVCAGFNDSHMHLLNFGNVMTQCNLADTSSLVDVQQRLRAYVEEKMQPEGAWVLGRGWNQDYFLPATGIPTRADLDQVTNAHPVCIVRCCGHCLVVNTYALELLGFDENTPCPEGGAMDRDASGRLTGVFRDAAMSLVFARLPAPDRRMLKDMLAAAATALNAVGVTSCQTDDFCAFENVPWTEVVTAYKELEAEGRLTVRVYEQCQFTTPAGLREFLNAGGNTGVGTEMFRFGPLKLLGDGSLGARTAFLSGSYADQPGEKGIAIFTQDQLNELIGMAHAAGMQCAVHAIGDGMLDRLLNAYGKAFAAHPRQDHRSGVVHVQLTRPDQLERMRQLQLHAYVQSIFLDYDSHIVRQRAGDALADSSYAFHSMKRMGLHVSNGTDCPVERPDPMRGVQCAVTRQPLDGSLPPYRPEEGMTVEEALLTYTAEGAHASFEETFKGCIAPGMAADFVVLSADPFSIAQQEIVSIRSLMTVLGGRVVYQAEGLSFQSI